MTRRRFTLEQRASIKRAAVDARSLPKGRDVVDLACETGNFFWSGLDDRQTRVALRLIGMQR